MPKTRVAIELLAIMAAHTNSTYLKVHTLLYAGSWRHHTCTAKAVICRQELRGLTEEPATVSVVNHNFYNCLDLY